MGKKSKQNASAFYTECEQWLKKNQQVITLAVKKRINDRIGPIGDQSGKKVYCSKASFELAVYDIHNPQLEVYVQYTLCDGKQSYQFKKTARAGLTSPLDTKTVEQRLCKNLSKRLGPAVSAISVKKITKNFLASEGESFGLDSLPAGTVNQGSVKQKTAKALTIKDIQDAFCKIKTSGVYSRNIEKYLVGVFSGYSIKDASMDIKVSAEVCKGGVQFKAVSAIFFPRLSIPLPKLSIIVNIENRYLSSRTKGECLNLFEGQARAGLGDLLREQLDVFAKKQLSYEDFKNISFRDPNYGAKLLLEEVKRTVTPDPDAMIQVHWEGMDYSLEKSAIFIGRDGGVRIYVAGIGNPIYTGTFSNGQYRTRHTYKQTGFSCVGDRRYRAFSYPDNIYDFVRLITEIFSYCRNDIRIVFVVDSNTMNVTKIEIGSAEYYPDQPEWCLPEQRNDAKEFFNKLHSEIYDQKLARIRISNEDGFTNAELQILQTLQQHPHRGKAFIIENMATPELSKQGRKLAFEERIQKFLLQGKDGTFYIHPQYANLPFSKICPASYSCEYSKFLQKDAMQNLFIRQLSSARLQTEYFVAFKTLAQSGEDFQESFLQTEQSRNFLQKFTERDVRYEIKGYVRFCLSHMHGGKELVRSVFAADIEDEIICKLNEYSYDDAEYQMDYLDYLRTVPPDFAGKALRSEQGRNFLEELTGEAVEDAKELLSELPDCESLIELLHGEDDGEVIE